MYLFLKKTFLLGKAQPRLLWKNVGKGLFDFLPMILRDHNSLDSSDVLNHSGVDERSSFPFPVALTAAVLLGWQGRQWQLRVQSLSSWTIIWRRQWRLLIVSRRLCTHRLLLTSQWLCIHKLLVISQWLCTHFFFIYIVFYCFCRSSLSDSFSTIQSHLGHVWNCSWSCIYIYISLHTDVFSIK